MPSLWMETVVGGAFQILVIPIGSTRAPLCCLSSIVSIDKIMVNYL